MRAALRRPLHHSTAWHRAVGFPLLSAPAEGDVHRAGPHGARGRSEHERLWARSRQRLGLHDGRVRTSGPTPPPAAAIPWRSDAGVFPSNPTHRRGRCCQLVAWRLVFDAPADAADDAPDDHRRGLRDRSGQRRCGGSSAHTCADRPRKRRRDLIAAARAVAAARCRKVEPVGQGHRHHSPRRSRDSARDRQTTGRAGRRAAPGHPVAAASGPLRRRIGVDRSAGTRRARRDADGRSRNQRHGTRLDVRKDSVAASRGGAPARGAGEQLSAESRSRPLTSSAWNTSTRSSRSRCASGRSCRQAARGSSGSRWKLAAI